MELKDLLEFLLADLLKVLGPADHLTVFASEVETDEQVDDEAGALSAQKVQVLSLELVCVETLLGSRLPVFTNSDQRNVPVELRETVFEFSIVLAHISLDAIPLSKDADANEDEDRVVNDEFSHALRPR